MPSSKLSTIKISILVLLCFASIHPAWGDEAAVATLDSAEGTVAVLLKGEREYQAVKVGAKFRALDTIRVGRHGRAGILFSTGVLLRLAAGSTLTFQGTPGSQGAGTSLAMKSGKGFFFSRQSGDFPTIQTPAVTTAVRGTEFVIEVSDQSTAVTVMNGQVSCFNEKGRVELNRGESATTLLGKAPVKAIGLTPRDAVRWSVRFPILLDLGTDAPLLKGAASREAIVKSMELVVVLELNALSLEIIN